MKKLSILLAGLFITGTMFTSCDKDEKDNVTANVIGKAVVKGKIQMNSDKTEMKMDSNGNFLAEVFEKPTAGTQLTLKIDIDELIQDPSNTINYAERTYYTEIDANGEYEFEIDAGPKTVNATITGVDIIIPLITYITVKQANNAFADSIDANGNYVYNTLVKQRNIWTFSSQTVELIEKDLKIIDSTYE